MLVHVLERLRASVQQLMRVVWEGEVTEGTESLNGCHMSPGAS